jgi:DNA-binding SARP family transcriptional activator
MKISHMLIDAYNKNGNRIAAISFYKNFDGRLRRNLNVFPAKVLKDLYNCLMTNDTAIIDLGPNYISNLASIQNKVLSVHEKNLKSLIRSRL